MLTVFIFLLFSNFIIYISIEYIRIKIKFSNIFCFFKSDKTLKNLSESIDFIEYFLLYLESGSNISQGIFYCIENLPKGTVQEMTKHVQFLENLGLSTSQAIHQATQSYKEHSCHKILETIEISLKYGSPLIQSLEHLSEQLKMNMTLHLEEVVEKAPVKMIFPLVFLIFPVIFILLCTGSIENFLYSISSS